MKDSIYTKKKGDYLVKNPNWHIEDSHWKAAQILKMIELHNLEPKTVAEVGCGIGEILNQMQQRMTNKGINFVGYEIAPDAFEHCLHRVKERLNYFHEDLFQIKDEFDLLLIIDVLEHVEDYLGFISEARKRATYIIFHIPLDISAFSILTNYPIGARKKVGHLHYFMKDTALATLTDTGYEIVDWFYTPGSLEIGNKGLTIFGKLLNSIRKFSYSINSDFAVKTFGGYSLLVLTKSA